MGYGIEELIDEEFLFARYRTRSIRNRARARARKDARSAYFSEYEVIRGTIDIMFLINPNTEL